MAFVINSQGELMKKLSTIVASAAFSRSHALRGNAYI